MNKKRKLTDFFASSASETGKKKASTSTNTNESTNSTLNQRQQQPEAGDISADKPFHPLETDQFTKKKYGTRERSFRAHWCKEFPWLHYDQK